MLSEILFLRKIKDPTVTAQKRTLIRKPDASSEHLEEQTCESVLRGFVNIVSS